MLIINISKIKLQCSGEKKITVIQDPGPNNSLNKNKINFSAAGGMISLVTVTRQAADSVRIIIKDTSWVKVRYVNPLADNKSVGLFITALKDTAGSRSNIVKITGDIYKDTVSLEVEQTAAPNIIVDTNYVFFDKNGGKDTITVKWVWKKDTLKVEKNASWFTADTIALPNNDGYKLVIITGVDTLD